MDKTLVTRLPLRVGVAVVEGGLVAREIERVVRSADAPECEPGAGDAC